MPLQKSVAARNAGLNGEVAALGASPILRLFTGAPPANCAAAATGLTLASLTLPTTPFGLASAGVIAMAGVWSGTASGGGYAGWWGLYDSTGTTRHFQGPVGQLASAWAALTTYAAGAKVANGNNIYLCVTGGASAASGGPTGTGSTIADGTVVWTYIGPSAANGDPGMLALDNVSIYNGQAVTVSDFSITAGNA